MNLSKKTLAFVISLSFLFSSATLFAFEGELKLPLHLKWTTKLKKETIFNKRPYQFAVPIIEGDRVYVGAASGFFYALGTLEGKKIWTTKLTGGIYGEASTDENNVYIADRKGIVYALSKADGQIEWQVETESEISSKPIVDSDTVYVSTVLRQIIALNKNGTGKKWQTTKTGSLPPMTIKGSSSPVLYNGNMYVGYADGLLAVYSASNGDFLWARQLSNKQAMFIDVDATPLIIDGIIYVSSADGKTFALDAKDGGIVWTANVGGANSVVADGDALYVEGNSKLSALTKDGGIVIWEVKLDEPGLSTPAVKDGVLIVASTKDKVYSINASNGEIKSKRFLGKGTFGKPVIMGNNVYLLGNSSGMFCLQGAPG